MSEHIVLKKFTIPSDRKANILNENKTLAIIGLKYAEHFTIFDEKCSFLRIIC